MRVVTPHQVTTIVEDIIAQKRRASKVVGTPFSGVMVSELSRELNEHLGDSVVTDSQKPQWDKQDLITMVNGRYFRKTGMTMLMAAVILMIAVSYFTTTVPIIPTIAGYLANAVVAVGFLALYQVKLKKYQKEFWDLVQGDVPEK